MSKKAKGSAQKCRSDRIGYSNQEKERSMRFNRLWRIVLVLLLLQTTNASVLKFADVLINDVNLKSKIVSSGVSGPNVNRLKSFINTSVGSLMEGSDTNLYQTIKRLRVDASDNYKKKQLLKALRKPAGKVTNDEFIEIVNDLVHLADRYGLRSASTLSCSVCVSDQLADLGLKASIKNISNAQLRKLLKRIPNGPKKIATFNSRKLKKLKVKDTLKNVRSKDMKTLALFLEMATSGDQRYKRLAKSILRFNTVNGEVELAGNEAPSELWKLVNTKLTDEKADKWTTAIESTLNKNTARERSDALFAKLREMANGDEDKLSNINKLQAKRCYVK